MLTQFICPDRKAINTVDCIAKCRLPQRCLTRTTLRVIVDGERGWDGCPHVTNLLNGTMLEFLRINRDYAIDPRSRAFALLGSSHHKLLEIVSLHPGKDIYQELLDQSGCASEVPLNIGWIQGTADLLEREDELVLSDHKTWGSNRLARTLPRGATFDPINTPPEMMEAQLQINMYRIMAKQQYGWDITKMQVQCTVRDGGLAHAIKRGVRENMYVIPVPMVADEIILAYFRGKAQRLQDTLVDVSKLPELCSPSEHWNGNRCRSCCEVAAHCPQGKQYIGG